MQPLGERGRWSEGESRTLHESGGGKSKCNFYICVFVARGGVWSWVTRGERGSLAGRMGSSQVRAREIFGTRVRHET